MSRTAAAPRPTGYLGYDCGEAHHNCLDVLRPDSCCDNQSYCYINGRGEARCCPIGSNCVADSPCSSRAYYCAVTVTVTTSLPLGSTATTAMQQGCCGRKCPQTSHFLCPPDLGGKCCPFGSRCQAGGNCLQIKEAETETETKTAASTSSKPASTCSAPGAESESCAGTEGLGGGGGHPESEKLSVGAKAGIGVAAVAVSLILGALWFRLQRRRRQRNRKCDIHGRVELTGSAVPARAQNKRMLAAEADHGMPQSPRHHNTVPVEMASLSVQATSSVILQERNYYPPFVSMPPECPASPDGVCELAGYDILSAEQLPSPLTPPAAPPPFPATSNDFSNGHKEKL